MDTALKAAWAAIDELIPDAQSIVAATAKGLIFGYSQKWNDSGWVSVAEEEEFHLPIINPDSGMPSRTFTYAGKFDGIADYNGKRFVRENKTTSDDISDPNAPYWQRLDIDAQISAYALARWQQGDKCDGVLFDVVRKPGIRPRKVTKEEIREANATGMYHGFRIPEGSVYQAGQQEDATLYMFRLSRETLDEPTKYFGRKTVYRLDSQMLDYARELWMISDAIRQAKASGQFYKNSGACMQWNRPCPYLGLCSGKDNTESGRWQRKDRVHMELPLLEDDGRKILTHSSMLTFKTCHKKYELKYLEGLERADKEEEEALWFGTVWHAAIESYWSHNKENAHGNAIGSPVNAAGEHSTASTANVPV